MSNKNIFDIVDQMEKNKKESNNIDDIFSMLDDVTKENDVIDNKPSNNGTVKKPEIPNKIMNYKKFSECFRNILNACDYGENNAADYVKGHKEAINKYKQSIDLYALDLNVLIDKLNNEIGQYESSGNLYSKGYYDGLFYCLKAYQKAKDLISDKIDELLKQELSK